MSLRAPTSPPSAPSLTTAIDPKVLQSIRQASQATNIDFDFLMAQAQQESGFQPKAAAKSSSARGLYQFIDSTWLEMVRRYGDRYGAGDLARQITVGSNGQPVVADPKLRQRILDMRNDPTLSAGLAAEYARSNKEDLQKALGRPISNADLYIAHFLGTGGATAFLKSLRSNAATPAASLFPEAAAANRSVFYNRKTGAARTVADIYKTFAAKIEKHSDAFAAAMQQQDGATGQSGMPLSSGRGMMALKPRMNATVIGMFNVIALTAMKAMGGELTLKKTAGGSQSIAPAPAAPTTTVPRKANEIA